MSVLISGNDKAQLEDGRHGFDGLDDVRFISRVSIVLPNKYRMRPKATTLKYTFESYSTQSS